MRKTIMGIPMPNAFLVLICGCVAALIFLLASCSGSVGGGSDDDEPQQPNIFHCSQTITIQLPEEDFNNLQEGLEGEVSPTLTIENPDGTVTIQAEVCSDNLNESDDDSTITTLTSTNGTASLKLVGPNKNGIYTKAE